MIPSTLFAFVAAVSSLVAVNGAVVPRDGSFTFLTPQPTSPFQGAGSTATTTTSLSSQSSSVTSTQSSTSTTGSPSTTTSQSSSATSTLSKTPTTTASTTQTTSVPTVSSGCVTSCPSIPTPSIPVTTAPPPPPGAANCNGVQQWQASFAYNAGDRVIFNNQLFTATQWTYNNAPPAHPDQWTAGATCAQPVVNKVNCSGVAAWLSTVAYTTGNRVTFNGHLWSAVQWTQSNSPGDTSGSWKDLGACA